DFPPYGAISFMQETIRSRPGEVVLLAIGPLTNVALLFAMDPEIPSLLKELVLMSGVFTSGNGHGPGAREWNVISDPMASAMVYKTRPPKFTAIGLEVTTKCVLDADECRRKFTEAGGPLSIVAEMAEVWFKGRNHITFHDPLAGAIIFEPELCEYRDGLVRVESAETPLAGLTSFNAGADQKPHRIATQVNSQAFFDHYFEVVNS
ncbi:MAG: nucleoside hydrolase, partial [Candidatus Poribacteria bacterium]|nr:nucleoside hydrolase [Candidatus Poribacteria bacterium]